MIARNSNSQLPLYYTPTVQTMIIGPQINQHCKRGGWNLGALNSI